MRRWQILLVVAACGLLAGVVALATSSQREPRYQGRSLSEWLSATIRFDDDPPVPVTASIQQAHEAISHIGTNALPWLVEWIQSEPPGWKAKIDARFRKWPRFLQRHFIRLYLRREESNSAQAIAAFHTLGPLASPAVPELARLAKQTNSPLVALQAMHALAYIGQEGLPPLVAVLADPRGFQRAHAASSIAMMHRTVTNAAPALPTLLESLKDPDPAVALQSANALGVLALQPTIVVPALTNGLQNSDPLLRYRCAWSLARFGGQGLPALPALLNALNDPDPDVRRQVTNAVRRIDPGVLRHGSDNGGREN